MNRRNRESERAKVQLEIVPETGSANVEIHFNDKTRRTVDCRCDPTCASLTCRFDLRPSRPLRGGDLAAGAADMLCLLPLASGTTFCIPLTLAQRALWAARMLARPLVLILS